MTVYIVQEPRPQRNRETGTVARYDVSPAYSYGSTRYVFASNDQPGLRPVEAFETAHKALNGFSDADYLLWVGGDPVALIIASMVAGKINRGRVRFLRWERNRRLAEGGPEGFYIPVDLNLK